LFNIIAFTIITGLDDIFMSRKVYLGFHDDRIEEWNGKGFAQIGLFGKTECESR
jgi:hypothetical protein